MSSITLSFRDLISRGERFHFATTTLGGHWSQPHDHDFAEVFWVVGGRGVERVNGQELDLTAGHLALVRPEDEHAFRGEDVRLRLHNLAFPWAELGRLCRRYPTLKHPFASRDVNQRRYCLTQPNLAILEAAAAPAESGDRSLLTLDRFLLTLEGLTRSLVSTSIPIPAWLARAATAENLRAGVEDFVAACQRSPEHVARTCRSVWGQTPTQLVTAARINYAAKLLGEGEASVLDVCFQSGFNNVGHFHACFKNRFGLTPVAYRNKTVAAVPSARTPI